MGTQKNNEKNVSRDTGKLRHNVIYEVGIFFSSANEFFRTDLQPCRNYANLLYEIFGVKQETLNHVWQSTVELFWVFSTIFYS